MRWRAISTEKPRIGSPMLTPSAARSSGSGVLARPSITTSVMRSPARAVAPPKRSRSVASVPPGAAECTDGHAEQNNERREGNPGRGTQQPLLPAQQQLQPAGPVLHRVARAAGHARHVAFSTIQAQSCEKLMP